MELGHTVVGDSAQTAKVTDSWCAAWVRGKVIPTERLHQRKCNRRETRHAGVRHKTGTKLTHKEEPRART